MHLLKENQLINNKWTVERFLGQGAFAEVYRVRHNIFGQQAMKVFKRVGMQLEEVVEILYEPVLLANINHPNIIRVFDADTTETPKGMCCFFTMEYVAGGTLEQFWKSFGDKFVPVKTVMNIMHQIGKGLCFAHSCNPPIVHRDIKPQNILVGYNDIGLRASIVDFGLAKKFNLLTMALTGLGTRIFKPPEVLTNLKADSPAGDIWALGICFYLLLTDRFPFSDEFDLEALDMDRFERPLLPPSRFNVSVDEVLDDIVFRCLAINPKERFQNALELIQALDQWQQKGKQRKIDLEASRLSSVIKNPLSSCSIPNEKEGVELARKAKNLACVVGKLNEAADLMEEAFNRWPQLRKKYEYHVTIWRKGVSG